jgi:aldehyde dehydrogenase (NAD+)
LPVRVKKEVKGLDLGPLRSPDGAYLIHLDGKWRPARSGGKYENVDPAARSTSYGRVPECTAEEVEAAVAAADRDFDAWRLASADFRSKVFFRLTELLREHEDYLVRTMTREMGKTLFDSRLDFLEAVGVCESLAPQGVNLRGFTHAKNLRGLAMECRVAPRGVAAIITPFNFPLAIPLAQVVAALVTGNTVVWKPSHLTPESSQAFALLLVQALEVEGKRQGFRPPPGIFHLLFGDAATGDALVRAERVRTVSFTGSKKVGDQVDAVASGLGKKVLKEVGGINTFYVHREADLDRAARNLLYGKTITAGQRCSSIQEVLVDEEVFAPFLEKAIALSRGVVHGPGSSPELAAADARPDRFSCPPLASAEQLERVAELVEASIAAGARVAHKVDVPPALAGEGFYHPLVFLTGVGKEAPLFREEVFGPVAVFTRVKDIREAIRITNEKVGIVACIDSRDKSATENFIERVLRTRIDDGRHGTGCLWGTKFGGDRGAGSGNPALDPDMAYAYCLWKTVYRAYTEVE